MKIIKAYSKSDQIVQHTRRVTPGRRTPDRELPLVLELLPDADDTRTLIAWSIGQAAAAGVFLPRLPVIR